MIRRQRRGWMLLIIGLTTFLPVELRAEVGRHVSIYYAPETNLEEIDVNILNQASPGSTINFAAFVLSDYRVIDALREAADKGVKVRIYLDPRELQQLHLFDKHPLIRLSRTQNVLIRVKSSDGGLMHLKGYTIGDVILRTGSANDSVSGLARQDNDLVLVTEREAAQSFNQKFELMWARPSNQRFETFYESMTASGETGREAKDAGR